MLLICPACATQYDVDDAKIPAEGRSVKCAACQHSWLAGPWNLNENRSGISDSAGFPHEETAPVLTPESAARPEPRHENYFSREAPRSFAQTHPRTHGSAALAALFDQAPEEQEEPVVEADWEEVDQPDHFSSIEEQLEEALNAEPIARLRLQLESRAARSESTSKGPFHKELSALREEVETAPGQVITGTAVTVAPPPAETPPPGEEKPTEDLTQEAGTALRTLARVLIVAVTNLLEALEKLIPTQIISKAPQEKSSRTPGDEQVMKWRERQWRKARNRLTPIRFIGWLIWTACFIGMLAVPLIFRTEIMNNWPQTTPVYSTIGLGPAPLPLELAGVEHRYALSDQGEALELRGFIRNSGEEAIDKPLLRAEARDANGDVLTSWVFEVDGPQLLQPQSDLPFLMRALAPTGLEIVALNILTPEERAALVAEGVEALEDQGEGFFLQPTTSGWERGL